ncbi:hypothetical protein KEM54_001711 [Ascosphaera aggregata]|nr:hypothetical protein KEM54_001711 [Ascosphaera aggregata]
MNRLMSRRKGVKDDQNIPVVPSFTKAFKKNRKAGHLAPPEPPKLDLAEVLPSTDDFRTSLLMPSLSARFSMLREQDDPTSKLGKANDDSVLFPKRASRLNLFNSNHPGLADIAEVSSYRGGSYYSRSESPNAESGTSIMERPRPAEGNILFAGRQKIYKIPAKKDDSTNDSYNGGSKGLSGKIVYGDDVTDSLFRKWSREQLEQKKARAPSDNSCPPDSTTSTSPPDRASASATSVGSQSHGSEHDTGASSVVNLPLNGHTPLPRVTLITEDNKSQTIQHEQMSPNRNASPAKPDCSSPRRNPSSAMSSAKANPISASEKTGDPRKNPRPSQPSPLKRTPSSADSRNYALTRNASVSCDGSRRRQRSISPTMRFAADGTPLVSALKPEDQGKTTALGIFNRPTITNFDEDEYMRLQRKMYEGRASPPGTRRRSPTEPSPSTESVAYPVSPSTSFPVPAGAIAGLSPAAMRQQFFQSAGMGRQEGKPVPPALPPGQPQQHPSILLGGCDEAQLKSATSGCRTHNGTIETANAPLPPSGESELSPIRESDNTSICTRDSDDLLLGRQKVGLGLRNLVRASLRPDSEISITSSAPSTSPESAYQFIERTQQPVPTSLRAGSYDEIGSPRHDVSRQMMNHQKPRQQVPAPSYGPRRGSEISNDIGARARQILEQANALRGQQLQRESEAEYLMEQYPRAMTPEQPMDTNSSPSPPWRNEIIRNTSRHRRDGSVETQMEREDLASDLAERRRLLQEKLKSAALEQESSNSPKSNTRLTPGPSGISSILKGRSRPGGMSRDPSPQRQKKYLNHNSSSTNTANEEGRESRSRTPRPTAFSRYDQSNPDVLLYSTGLTSSRTDEATPSRCFPRTANYPSAAQAARPSLETVQEQGTCPDYSGLTVPRGRPRGSSRSLAYPPSPPAFPLPELPSGVNSTTVEASHVRSPTLTASSVNTIPPVYDSSGYMIPATSPEAPNRLDAYRRPANESQIPEPVLVSTSIQSPAAGFPAAPRPPKIPSGHTRRRQTSHTTRMEPKSGPFGSPAMSRSPRSGLEYSRHVESIQQSASSHTRKTSNESQRSSRRSRSGTHPTPRPLHPPIRPAHIPIGK